MSKSHVIYHIPGQKVGCTVDYIARQRQYPEGTKFEVIGVFNNLTDKQAGDIEWLFADAYGYPRGSHYTSNWNNHLNFEQRSANGKKGARTNRLKKQGSFFNVEEHLKACSNAGKKMGPINVQIMNAKNTPEMCRKAGVIGGKRSAEVNKAQGTNAFFDPQYDKANGTKAAVTNRKNNTGIFSPGVRHKGGINSSTRTLTCPHCGKEGKGRVMFRWHFDNCKSVATDV